MSEKELETEKEEYNLPFTEEELKQLNFTPEELEILDFANSYVELANELDGNPDELINKLDTYFPKTASPEETFEKLGEVCETDPEFISQLIATQELLSDLAPEQEREDRQ